MSVLTKGVACLLLVAPANAAYLITVTQSGGSVVVSGSGTLNLTGAVSEGDGSCGGGHMGPSFGQMEVGQLKDTACSFYVVSGPANFGGGNYTVPNSGTGLMVGVSSGALITDSSYVSGAQTSGTATWNSATFASLGLTPGTYVYSWGSGANADSLTVQIGPVPLPVITSVENAASQITPGLPGSAIAQGSIFLIQGSGLGPANIAIDPNVFQDVLYGGTSISVTIAGTTVKPLIYYTASAYVAALMPSDTPAGTGTITVTYNGQQSSAAAITVVPNSLGIFTYTQDGQGIGIVTFADYTLVSSAKAANCGAVLTACGAANPGDTLIVWTTGLGPINGSDAAGAGLGVNMPNIPLHVLLGGVSITPFYQGRSGCCIGEDQIAFTIPNNVPLGCAVPLALQVNDQVSNFTSIALAASGRSCTPVNGALSSVDVEQLVSSGPITYADIKLHHVLQSATVYQDLAKFQFSKLLTYVPNSQPFFNTYIDNLPLGTCTAYRSLNPGSYIPAATQANANAGSNFSISGPKGTQLVQPGSGLTRTTLSNSGIYLTAGAYTVSSTGGPDIGAINAAITMPARPTLTAPNPNVNAAASRSNGMVFSWNGGGAGYMLIIVQTATDGSFSNGSTAVCSVSISAGTFTVPSSVLQTLPVGIFGNYLIGPQAFPVSFTANGLNLGILEASDDGVTGTLSLQ